ncbi:MAG: Gfo/Idh/MocA family oxidoreductase [Dysgonamonadaceae bacterium]|nr:Gfo/Idh/MocA family oxidoreductase [Dysgonamonadaceae bacterium]MDD4727797.1 Gfo/Idh/MocA family oxidoreductase [Dysgonamonadaceae bacterium]
MTKKIKWGVIGSGGIARRRTIPEGIMQSKNAELISVYDINSDVNKAVAKEFNATAAESIDALLNSDIDAVYIASPANMHIEHVKMCAAAKKHILCEKPLGLTVEEAEVIVKVCKEAEVFLGIGLMMRFIEQHQAALKLIQDGKLGKPVFGRAQLSAWYPPIEGAWRQDPSAGGGGSLMDMGSHCIDLLEMYFGKIKSVSCFINNIVHSYKSEDSAVVSLFFENGALATVDSYFCIPDNSSKNVLELYGSKGSIIAKGTIGQGESGEMIAYLEDDVAGYDAQQARTETDGLVINPTPVNAYLAEIDDFSKAILENREPKNNHEVGLISQKIIEACYESAKTGRVIDIKY